MPSKLILQSVLSKTPVWPPLQNVEVLLHGNGATDGTDFPNNSSVALTFNHSSGITTQPTPAGDGSRNTFSTSSIYSNGGYLSLTPNSNTNLVIGTADFSFEFFFYPVDNNFGFIFDTRVPGPGSNPGFFVCYSFPDTPSLNGHISFGSIPGLANNWFHSTTALELNKWHYIVISRVGTYATLAIDGDVVPVYADGSDPNTATAPVSFDYDIVGPSGALISASNSLGEHTNGYFNEMRLTVGVSANPGPVYKVPTAPFPNAS